MAPLLDPFKMIIGKYDINNTSLYNLPSFDSTSKEIHEKILDQNNTAYVDSLFTFFTSQLNKAFKFEHGLDFYGSFLAIKQKFVFNIVDDLDFICKSDYFNKNKNILFKVEDYNFGLRKNVFKYDEISGWNIIRFVKHFLQSFVLNNFQGIRIRMHNFPFRF
jgi:hypothetical protein